MRTSLGRCLRAALFFSLVVSCLSHSRKFPPGFLLGTSTASYQIEGAWNTSGKGQSIWDHLMLTNPNFTMDHQWGDVACDSYHHIDKDLDMLRELGLDMYRFSVSWPRLLPTGYSDVVNREAVAYYNYVIDSLLASGITPMVTIFHWDLPQSMQDLGGWANPELADYYVDYAKIVLGLFGDRVKLWISFNEPHHFCTESYGYGNMAPGLNLTGIGEYKCGHNILRAHAKIYHIYKQTFAAQKGKMSISLDSQWYEPKNPSSVADIQAAERRMQFESGWFAHPIFTSSGGYPPAMVQRIDQESRMQGLSRSRLPSFTPQERAALIGSADFFAMNHYLTLLIEDRRGNPDPKWATPSRERDMALSESSDPSWKRSDAMYVMSNVPWGFRKLLNWVRTHYNNPPVAITENGFPDKGGLKDYGRIDYLSGFLNAILDAIYYDHCNIFAYTCWSLMDNFEWQYGYTVRFGLYSVDFNDPNRTRTPKLSAGFIKKLGETRELSCSRENCTASADPQQSLAPIMLPAMAHLPHPSVHPQLHPQLHPPPPLAPATSRVPHLPVDSGSPFRDSPWFQNRDRSFLPMMNPLNGNFPFPWGHGYPSP